MKRKTGPKNRMRLQSVQKLHEHIELLDSRYSGSDGDQQD